MRLTTGSSNFAKQASGWLAIGLVAFATVFYFTDMQLVVRSYLEGSPSETQAAENSNQFPDSQTPNEIHLHAAENGHFFSDIEINGRTVNVVVDTGATAVSLTYEDARSIGLRLDDSDFTMQSQTANGTAKIAPVVLDKVQIGDIEVREVDAYVAEPGKLFQTLLGMSFLRRLGRVDFHGGEMVLSQ